MLLFVDFTKAFDSIERDAMFKILRVDGIPPKRSVIKEMYNHTSAVVLTPYGPTWIFDVTVGLLQGDTLAPFLFIMVFDYVMRPALTEEDGVTLQRRMSRRHPAQKLSDLSYADDITVAADSLQYALGILSRIEETARKVSLLINSSKSKVRAHTSSSKRTTNSQGSKW